MKLLLIAGLIRLAWGSRKNACFYGYQWATSNKSLIIIVRSVGRGAINQRIAVCVKKRIQLVFSLCRGRLASDADPVASPARNPWWAHRREKMIIVSGKLEIEEGNGDVDYSSLKRFRLSRQELQMAVLISRIARPGNLNRSQYFRGMANKVTI